MKQVNFKELSVETGIDNFESVDLRQGIGNAIHRQATNVPMSELARKIYYYESPFAIDEEDYAMMLAVLEKSFPMIVSEAVKRSTTDFKEEEVSHD